MITCPRCGAENVDTARFCNSCGNALAVSGTTETRKTVTVLFTDAVGSTAVGERTDPESMRRVMTRYFDEIRTIVERHGGVVEKYIGDAVMAVFGVPAVHEDDALRAVRAGVEIRDRLSEIQVRIEAEGGLLIGWRTGINTGEVVAGDTSTGQRFVSGDTVNIAARLQQAAHTGELLIGASTYWLVRDFVTVAGERSVEAKGKSTALEAYAVSGISGAAGSPSRRVEAPLIGRRRQARLLGEAFEQVVDERICHLFTILGAAGVGKSRLVNEFVASIGDAAQTLQGRCLSYGEGITYWPIAEVIRQAAELTEEDDDHAVKAKIGALVADERDRSQVVARVEELLGRADSRPSGAEEIFWAVRTLLESIARRRPLVLVLDDIHWAEPTLLDLVDHIADWSSDAPILLVCLARQSLLEARSGWAGGKRYATTLTLEPLSEEESKALIESLLGQIELGTDLLAKIGRAAEGNPLFVEEMVGMLIDSGVLERRNGSWTATRDLAEVRVPPSIQALLAARVDALPAAERVVIERGAVEGKVFHRGAVAELVPANVRDQVAGHLRSLSRKELVGPDRSDFAGDDAFRFRHLMIREAVYSAMPKEARAELHARFAGWLERMAGERSSEYEEILGYHLERSYRYRAELGPLDDEERQIGLRAARHLAVSGRRAQDRGDVQAAVKLLGSALEMTPARSAGRHRLLAELATALMVSGDVRKADEMATNGIEEAISAGDTLGAAQIEIVEIGIRQTLHGVGTEEAIAGVERLLPIFVDAGDSWGIERATLELSRQHFFAGRAQVAYEMLIETLDSLPAGARPPQLLVGMLFTSVFWGPMPVGEAIAVVNRVQVDSRAIEAFKARVLGGLHGLEDDFEAARGLLHASIALEREMGRRHMVDAVMGHVLAPMEIAAGNLEEAERLLLEAYGSMRARGDIAFASTAAGHLARVYVGLDRVEEAERFAKETIELSTEDDLEARGQGAAAMARVLAARGEFDSALEQARLAVTLLEQTDYLESRGLVNADLAEVLLAAGQREQAVAAMRRALENMQAKGATAHVERMTRSLAQLEGSGG